MFWTRFILAFLTLPALSLHHPGKVTGRCHPFCSRALEHNNRKQLKRDTVRVKHSVPDAPEIPTVDTITARSVRLRWSSPPVEGGILYYLLLVQQSDGQRRGIRLDEGDGEVPVRRIRMPDNGTEFVVMGLRPVTGYTFQIIAVNAQGHSRPSRMSSVYYTKNEPQPPGTPVLITAQNASSTSIRLQWLSPPVDSEENGSPAVKGYRLTYRQAAPTSWSPAAEADDERTLPAANPAQVHEILIDNPQIHTYEIRRLMPYQRYYISIQAYNDDGYSAAHTEVIRTAEGVPGAPYDLLADEVTDTSIQLSWLPPVTFNGIVLGYKLHYTHPAGYTDSVVVRVPDGGNFSNVADGSRASEHQRRIGHRISGLLPYSVYYIQVGAFTSSGAGALTSKGLTVWTDVERPDAPDINSVVRVADNALLVQWEMPPLRPLNQRPAQTGRGADSYRAALSLADFRVYYRHSGDMEEAVIIYSVDLPLKVPVRPRSKGADAASRGPVILPASSKSTASPTDSTKDYYVFHPSNEWNDCPFQPYRQYSEAVGTGVDDPGSDGNYRCIAEAVLGNLTRTGSYSLRIAARRRSIAHPQTLLASPLSAPATFQMDSTPDMDTPTAKPVLDSSAFDLTVTEVGLIVGVMLVMGIMLVACGLYCAFRKRFFLPGYSYLQLGMGNGHVNGTCGKGTGAMSPYRTSKIEINQNSRIPATDLPHRIKKLYADGQIGLSREYESLASILTQSATTDTTFVPSMKEALKLENRPKNRYVNVLPYDHSRVKLKTQWGGVPVGTLDKEAETQPLTNGKVEAEQEDSDSNCGGCFSSGGPVKNATVVDYMNASFVDGIHAPDAYILTQAPMTNTLADFWCMVWDYNVRVVIMLTNLEENGRKKSELYWPTAAEQPATYGPFTVGLVSEMVTAFYTVRTFSLTYRKPGEEGEVGETRQVVQYMYNDWPDHGRPDITVPLLRFIIKSSRAFEDDNFGPPIVHCSAGVGRSGCYIALHSLMLELDRTGHVDIFTYLLNARKQRMGLCQNESQYALIYDALLEYMQSGHTEVYAATFDEYMDTLISSDMAGLKLQHKLVVGARSVCSSGGFNFANSFEYATQGYNKGKNRSEQYVPTDVHANRVGITPKPGELGSDYINASFLPGYWRSKEWVITQRPLEGTVAAFWQMIWDYKIPTVLHVLDTDTPDLAFIPPPSTPLRTTDFTVTQLPADPAAPSLLPDTPPSQPWEHRTLQCRLAVIMPDNAPPIPTEDLVCQVVPVQLPPGENPGWWDLLERVEGIMGKGMTVVMDETGGPEAGLLAGAVMIRQMVVGEGSVDVYGVARLYNHIRPGVFDDLSPYRRLYEATRSVCRSAAHSLPVSNVFFSPAGMLQTTPPTKLPLSLSKRLSAILEEENAVAS